MKRRILITGASSGIGRALAEHLAGPHVELIVTGRHLDRLDEVASVVRGKAGTIQTYCVELSSEAAVEAFARTIVEQGQGIDVLINNAAVIKLGVIEAADIEELDWHYRVNLRAPVMLIRQLFEAVRSVRGQFVMVNSTAGLNAYSALGYYAATKHGLKAIADSLRDEVFADGMTVLSVFPGRTNTPMQQRVLEMASENVDSSAFVQPHVTAAAIVSAMERCRKGEINNVTIRPGWEPEFW